MPECTKKHRLTKEAVNYEEHSKAAPVRTRLAGSQTRVDLIEAAVYSVAWWTERGLNCGALVLFHSMEKAKTALSLFKTQHGREHEWLL